MLFMRLREWASREIDPLYYLTAKYLWDLYVLLPEFVPHRPIYDLRGIGYLLVIPKVSVRIRKEKTQDFFYECNPMALLQNKQTFLQKVTVKRKKFMENLEPIRNFTPTNFPFFARSTG